MTWPIMPISFILLHEYTQEVFQLGGAIAYVDITLYCKYSHYCWCVFKSEMDEAPEEIPSERIGSARRLMPLILTRMNLLGNYIQDRHYTKILLIK